MSFILDQLKKSGKQRMLEKAIRRQTEKTEAITDEPLLSQAADRMPVRHAKWQFAVVVLLGAVALYGGVYFLSRTSWMRQPVAPVSKSLDQEASQLPVASSSLPSVQVPRTYVQEGTVSKAQRPATEQKQTGSAKAVKHETAPDRGSNAPEKTGSDSTAEEKGMRAPAALMDVPLAAESSDTVLAGSVPAGAALADSVMTGSVPDLKQLPQAVRTSLPEIRITAHLYRKDSRLVSINGIIMSEGQNMDDGLYLEEITPDGVILRYGKYRFLVRAGR